ncbi:MAG: O-antigen ligase family protein [Candidatus Omnitrophica bacterium]|nr:O-antigen ligase family protein [Candidatus Omnitrophota bacterium]
MTGFLLSFYGALPLVFSRLLDDIFLLPKQVFLYAGATVCFLFLVSSWQKKGVIFLGPFFWPLLLIVLARFVSIFPAVNKHATASSVAEGLSFLVLVLGITGYLQETEPEKRRRLFFLLVSVSLLVCLYGFFQLAGFDFFPWEVPAGSQRSLLSTLGRRNFTAEYLVAVLPFSFFLLVTEKSLGRKIFFLVTGLVGLLALALSFTRASYLGLAGMLLFLLPFFKKKPNFQVVIFLALVSLWQSSQAQVMKFDPTSGKSRLLIWKASLAMFQARPFLGVGAGNFEFVYLPYAKKVNGLVPVGERVANAHNDYLEVAAEQGLLGLVTWLWLVICFFQVGLKGLAIRKKDERLLLLTVMASTTGILVNSLAAFPLENPAVVQILALNLAVVSFLSQEKPPVFSGYLKPAMARIISTLVCLVFFVCASASLSASYLLKKSRRLINLAGQTANALFWALAERNGRLAAAFNPYSLEAHFHLGNIYLSGNYPAYARDEFATGLKIAPYSDAVANNLGISYHRLNQLAEAEKYYLYSLELNEKRPETYNNLGSLYLEQEKKEKAIVCFQKALRLDPTFSLAKENLERALLEK